MAERYVLLLTGRKVASALLSVILAAIILLSYTPGYAQSFELNLDDLSDLIPDYKKFRQIPKFPATSRDLTIIVDNRVEAGELIENIRQLDEALIENIHLFAVYEGDPIPSGKKSISVRLTYRSAKETLEDNAINEIHKNITDQIILKLDATLPA